MLVRFLYKSYKIFYTIRLWRKRHFTSAGLMVLICFFVSGLLGFNVLRTTLYQFTVLSFSVMMVSILLSMFPFRFKVRVNRILPEYSTVGRKVFYEIEITNLSLKTQKGLILYEDFLDPRPSIQSLQSRKEPFENHRNAWDKKTLYYRWLWLILKNQKALIAPIELPDIGAKETIKVSVSFVPLHRGYIHFSGFVFARPDLLGLFNRLSKTKKVQKLLVLPERVPIESVDLMATRQYQPGGISFASSIGNNNEFMSLRQYRPGDPMRNIHWKTFAKTNELVIKEFEDEYFVRHALILDTYLSSGDEDLFEQAVIIASSFLSSMQTHDSILDLMFVGNQIYSFPSGRGLGHCDKMLEIMACVEPNCDKTIFDLIPSLESNMRKFAGSICIFLGWDKGHKKIYRMYKQIGTSVLVIVLAADKLKMEEKIFQDIENLPKDIRVVQKGDIKKDQTHDLQKNLKRTLEAK
jgi:uncharacterized protein (DUF58 family)